MRLIDDIVPGILDTFTGGECVRDTVARQGDATNSAQVARVRVGDTLISVKGGVRVKFPALAPIRVQRSAQHLDIMCE